MFPTILHDYPYPIAKCYERLLRARAPAERIALARYLFETTLKYSACIAVAGHLNSADQDALTRDALACLARPSLGHWANLLRHSLRDSQKPVLEALAPPWLQKTRQRPALVEAYNLLREFIDDRSAAPREAVAPLSFADTVICYRNRSVGHGAPQTDHTEQFAPVFEAGVVELVLHLEVLRDFPLVHLGEIRAQRRHFAHALTLLMGTAQVPLPDLVTTSNDALLGSDRTIYLMDSARTTPLLSIHPLAVYVRDEVYLLQSCDLHRTVTYLCHHTGATYAADHLYEDFRDQFASFFEPAPTEDTPAHSDAVYEGVLRMSLLDGVIEPEERRHLDELADRLAITAERAAAIERSHVPAAASQQMFRAEAPAPYARSLAGDQPAAAGGLNQLFEQHNELLRSLGQSVLDVLSRRADPSTPLPLVEMARCLGAAGASSGLGSVAPQQLARLLTDVQNHGFAPGVKRLPGGYAILEDHMTYKVTRDRELKDELARAAMEIVHSGTRIGLDGGSTTLPIAREIAVAIDSELLADLVIVTNSIPVAQEFADLVERRGWSDADAPVEILLCSGRIRAVTKAIAEPKAATTHTRDSLDTLLRLSGGLDYCFIGANGLTRADGITMPTDMELSTKRQFLAAARAPYIVADIGKIGVRHPVRIAGWDESLTVLTNPPRSSNQELERILAEERRVEIVFAGAAKS